MQKQYDDELKGAFFTESKSEVLYRGSMQVDGKKKYGIIVRSENKDGKTKHELMFSSGLVHLTDQAEKINANSPDIGGRVQVEGKTFKFGGWNKTSDNGLSYYSASLQKLEDEQEAPF